MCYVKWTKSIKWRDVVTDLLLLVFLTVLPTICLLLWGRLTGSIREILSQCYCSGEFLLYSEALVTSAYVALRRKKGSAFVVISLVAICISYVVILMSRLTLSNEDSIDTDFILILSIVFFALGFLECLLGLCEQHRVTPDARKCNSILQDRIIKSLK